MLRCDVHRRPIAGEELNLPRKGGLEDFCTTTQTDRPTCASFIKKYNKSRRAAVALKTLPLSMFVELSFPANGPRRESAGLGPTDGPTEDSNGSSRMHKSTPTTPLPRRRRPNTRQWQLQASTRRSSPQQPKACLPPRPKSNATAVVVVSLAASVRRSPVRPSVIRHVQDGQKGVLAKQTTTIINRKRVGRRTH